MNITINNEKLSITLQYRREDGWTDVPDTLRNDCGLVFTLESERRHKGISWRPYHISVNSSYPTQVRLNVSPENTHTAYHVIPCNIYGDNNAKLAHAGEFPLLTEDTSDGDIFKSPRWEYRADRAAIPISAVCMEDSVFAVSVEPYSRAADNVVFQKKGDFLRSREHSVGEANPGAFSGNDPGAMYNPGRMLHNGLFAELPATAGVSLGYTNDPVSFVNKRTPGPSTWQMAKKAEMSGRIYVVTTESAEADREKKTLSDPGAGKGSVSACVDYTTHPRLLLHLIIREEYEFLRDTPRYSKDFKDAVRGCFESFRDISWSQKFGEYTNCSCLPPENRILSPWRQVAEIGWTGGAVLAYPLILAEDILNMTADDNGAADSLFIQRRNPMVSCDISSSDQAYQNAVIAGTAEGSGNVYAGNTIGLFADSGYKLIDRIVDSYNVKSGLINDLMHPIDSSGSNVNGWWSGFGLTDSVHCSYNVGSALHYILKSIDYLVRTGRKYPDRWLAVCRQTMDTVISLQRDDGAFGYTYYTDRKGVADWEGFAGCWFVPSAAYLYKFTNESKYLSAAKRGLAYYQQSVEELRCCGTPMDTWKAMDEEGNLAFIRGARLLYEATEDPEYLTALREGADWECLWRYGYRTRPDFKPLNDGWNSCGGSVTSVSNPHIHPMGMIVDSDLYYLGKITGDSYYTERAKDGTNWIMQTLELYPEKTGYGQYGVLSERWCPSDGLVIQRDSDGKPYSSWFSYNLWAAAAAFEEACERELSWNE